MSNKISSILIVATIAFFIGILENKGLIFTNKESYFIRYNIFLIILYLVVSTTYLVKSISQREYIYSVISSSIFLFGVYPDKLSVVGYFIIFAAAFYMFLYNKRQDKLSK